MNALICTWWSDSPVECGGPTQKPPMEAREDLEARLGALPEQQARERLQQLGLPWSRSKAARTKMLAEHFATHPRQVVETAAPKMDPRGLPDHTGHPPRDPL